VINYRCFGGDQPTVWRFAGENLTSFVGPNNAGKSTILRLLYEMRSAFAVLQDETRLIQFAAVPNQGLSFLGVGDPVEIPSFGSTGPVIVEITIEVEHATQVARTRLTIDRETFACNARHWAGPDLTEITPIPNAIPLQSAIAGKQAIHYDSGPIREVFAKLAGHVMYIPAYRNLINVGSGTHYDVSVGTGFVQTWDQWKNGDSVINRRVISGVVTDIKNIFGFHEFTVEGVPDNSTFQLSVDGRSERIRELGAGLSQFIMVLGNVAIKKPDVLLIDEPELNLHPALQLKFLSALSKYTNHIAFATHSIGLARCAERVYSVTRSGNTSVIKPLPEARSFAELAGEMSFSAYRELGFDQILCVEGVHDVRAVQCFLRLLHLDLRIVVLTLGGDQLITAGRAPELSELIRLANRVYVLIDSERSAAGQPLAASRQQFVDTCRTLGINVHVTERRAFEHYLTDAAVKAVKGPSYRALEPYEDFRAVPRSWSKADNWRIAERMTEGDLAATDIGQWLLQMQQAIN
jgi:energy-coupling factor transporter ATP-binding protein EcfA2